MIRLKEIKKNFNKYFSPEECIVDKFYMISDERNIKEDGFFQCVFVRSNDPDHKKRVYFLRYLIDSEDNPNPFLYVPNEHDLFREIDVELNIDVTLFTSEGK